MKKIYVKNNYLIIEWSGSAPFMRPRKNVFFYRNDLNHEKYFITDNQKTVPPAIQNVLWTDFIKEDDTPFASITEFNEWITANTGNFNPGSNIGTFVPGNHDLAEFKNNSSDKFAKVSQVPEKGEKGDKGDRGEQGIQGVAGLNGTNGIDGKNGLNGAQGIKGDIGSTGPKGETGDRGLQGEKGDKGNDGSQGPIGLTGPKGDIGNTGAKGDQGIQGIKGDTGAQGPIGLTGSQGLQGIQGIQGVKGDTGSQGVAGVNSFSLPTLRTPINKATPYQALNPLKPAIITITLNATSNATLSIATNNSANIIIGATTAVATGTGSIVGKYNNTLSVGVLISTGIANTYTVALPIGWYFAILNSNGTTGVSIDSVFDQTVG